MSKEVTLQEMIDYITGKFPDAYAHKWAMHSWIIKSGLCGQIGLYAKTEEEAWKECYFSLLKKYNK